MKLKPSLYSAVLHLSLIALGGLVVVLAQENRQLKHPPLAPAVNPPGLEVGQSLEPVALQHLDGVEETLDFATGDKDRLLLVFTTTCPACRANQDAWKALHEQVGGSMEVVGISLNEVADVRGYREAHDLTFPVAVPSDRDHLSEVLAISAVPMTIRVGADGRVRGSWLGALSEAQLAEVQLPEIQLAEVLDHG